MQFPKLFEPFQTRRFSLKNRIVVLPHGTGMVQDGIVTPAQVAYLNAQAKAGAGLIITGGTIAHPTSCLTTRKLTEAYNEAGIDRLRQGCDAVHAHGAKIFGQILHLGRESASKGDFRGPALAPSVVRSPRDAYPPQELDQAMIADIVRGFGTSAANLKKAHYDGVEIHGAHGYLVAQFLSPATNLRTDDYGGTQEKRLRFLREIIDSIRTAAGDDFALMLRLSADEEVEDGLGVEDTMRIAEAVARLGSVDGLNLTMGMRGAYVKDMTAPEAITARAAKRVRDACGLPIVCGLRITRPETAERVLADGAADMIGMARALVADNQWIMKAETGQANRIRPCLNWNQDCREFSPHLHCSVNPSAGRELEPLFQELRPANPVKRIAVIGGGPGGLEAALTAASRGHRVTLFEATQGLGGQFLYAATVPSRTNLRRLLDHQIDELRRLSVEIQLGRRVDSVDDLGGHFDTAIVATGAVANPIDAQVHGEGVVSWIDMFSEGVPQPRGSGRAIFVDDGTGFWWNYGTAEALVKAGWQLTYVTRSGSVGLHIPFESMPPLLGRLAAGPTDMRILSMLESVVPGEARVQQLTSGESEAIPCDLVVAQTGRASVPGPGAALKAAGLEVHMIGDCLTPRRSSHAIYDAQRVARTI